MRRDELDYKLWRFITRSLLKFIIIVLAAIVIVGIVLKLSNRPIVIENPLIQPTQPILRPTPTALPTPPQPQTINQNIYNDSVIFNGNPSNVEVNYYNQAQAPTPLPSPTPLLLPTSTPLPPPPMPAEKRGDCIPANPYRFASGDCGSCKRGDMRYEPTGGCNDLFCKTLYGQATAWSYEEALAMARFALENTGTNRSCEGEPIIVKQKEFDENGRKCFYIRLEKYNCQ